MNRRGFFFAPAGSPPWFILVPVESLKLFGLFSPGEEEWLFFIMICTTTARCLTLESLWSIVLVLICLAPSYNLIVGVCQGGQGVQAC